MLASVANAQTRLVIVSGLGGEPKYTQSFAQLSTRLAQAAHERAGIPDSAIIWMGEQGAARSKWFRGVSTRDSVVRALDRIADAKDAGPVIFVLIGHGSGEGIDTRISLPGPDLAAGDFARMLAKLAKRKVAFINLTSASGDMAEVLTGANRVIVTATRTAFERNESQFARYLIDAFANDGADTDKDGRVSLLEAFRYADAETKRYYESESRLATEHPQIVDAGNLAGRFFLAGGAGTAPADSRAGALYAEMTTLDEQIAALKLKKASMSVDAYETELERLLVLLARKAREIRAFEKSASGSDR